MPKYTFKCEHGHEIQTHVSSSVKSLPCKICNLEMNRLMPTLNGPANVRELIDKYTGITHIDGQLDLIKERRDDYYWAVEVPRFVNSGTYSIETMLENEWITVDDAGKIHINNKPLAKR